MHQTFFFSSSHYSKTHTTHTIPCIDEHSIAHTHTETLHLECMNFCQFAQQLKVHTSTIRTFNRFGALLLSPIFDVCFFLSRRSVFIRSLYLSFFTFQHQSDGILPTIAKKVVDNNVVLLRKSSTTTKRRSILSISF